MQYWFLVYLIEDKRFLKSNKLIAFCENQIGFFNSNAKILKSTLEVGEFTHPTKKHNEAEAAALMKTILILYNLEETITKS